MSELTTFQPDPTKTRKQNYDAYIQSPQWRIRREAAVGRAGGKCQLCASTRALNVHHNDYARLFDELPTDLVALCAKCHKHFHGLLPVDELMAIDAAGRRKIAAENAAARASKRESWMPLAGEGDIALTHSIIESFKTPRGGFNGPTLRMLGVPQPLPPGWHGKLVGVYMTREKIDAIRCAAAMGNKSDANKLNRMSREEQQQQTMLTLTKAQKLEIIKMAGRGRNHKKIGRYFGINKDMVREVIRGFPI